MIGSHRIFVRFKGLQDLNGNKSINTEYLFSFSLTALFWNCIVFAFCFPLTTANNFSYSESYYSLNLSLFLFFSHSHFQSSYICAGPILERVRPVQNTRAPKREFIGAACESVECSIMMFSRDQSDVHFKKRIIRGHWQKNFLVHKKRHQKSTKLKDSKLKAANYPHLPHTIIAIFYKFFDHWQNPAPLW